jgi:hypothetical protein
MRSVAILDEIQRNSLTNAMYAAVRTSNIGPTIYRVAPDTTSTSRIIGPNCSRDCNSMPALGGRKYGRKCPPVERWQRNQIEDSEQEVELKDPKSACQTVSPARPLWRTSTEQQGRDLEHDGSQGAQET